MIPFPSNYKTKKEHLSSRCPFRSSKIRSLGTHNLRFCVPDASVCEFRDLLLTGLAVIGVVLNTSVSDLCHVDTPKVVGF